MVGVLLCIQLTNQPTTAHASSLQQAMEAAASHHPELQMAAQQIARAKGNLTEQGAYAYNPELSLEPQRRRLNGGGKSNDYYITLSQGVELGGKRGFRQQSAQAALEAAKQRKNNRRQQVIIEAARSFVALYFAGKVVALRQQQQAMLNKVNHAVAQKLALGESSQLDANLAQSVYASARNAAAVAQQMLTQARQRFRVALGQVDNGAEISKPILPHLDSAWQPPVNAYQTALAARADVAALRAKQEQFDAQADLADAARIPDVTISAMTAREAGEQLLKLGVTIPIPLLNSHRGAFQAALAEKQRVRTGLEWSQQQLHYAVQSAVDNHANAMRALSNMVNTTMQQNAQNTITLAQRAYDAGELDLEELVVHIRQGLDAQMTALKIIKQGWQARIQLAAVLGHPEYILQGIQQ